MMKYTFIVFVIVHILCDFYFQTEKTAFKKQTQIKWVLYHSLIYGGMAVLLFMVFLPYLDWKYMACFICFHGVIDVGKYGICKYLRKFESRSGQINRTAFFADQFLHIVVIIIIVYAMREIDMRELYSQNTALFFSAFGISEMAFLTWIVKILALHKPVNIMISHILAFYKPAESSDENHKNAGRYIGTLERIIMAVFISLGQYSAVGLVLTAKSIARYDRISKEQDFAEYYLLGTLLSTISAVCISIMFL